MEIKKINFGWKVNPGPYNGWQCETLRIGKIAIASYGHSCLRDDETPWHAGISLPSIANAKYFQTREECKAYVESIVISWANIFFAHCELS